jgi:hypothetical protein
VTDRSGPAPGTWRFLTWNLDWHRRNPERIPRAALLASYAPTVVALQEVPGHVAKALRASHAGPTIFSQELHPKASWRWMGCGLLLPPGAHLLGWALPGSGHAARHARLPSARRRADRWGAGCVRFAWPLL